MIHMLGELVPLLVSYKFPQIIFGATVAFIIWKYLVPKKAAAAAASAKKNIVQNGSSTDFVPVPLESDDEVGVREQSVNADIQDMRMQRKIRMRAGWKTRGWADSELMPPKSRRWEGIHQQ